MSLETSDGFDILGRGAIRGNTIEFLNFSLSAGATHRLTVRGIRADAVFLGISSTFPTNYVSAEVLLVRRSTKQVQPEPWRLELARVVRSHSFDAGEMRRSWIEGDQGFYAASFRFAEFFPGAFKTKVEEGGDHGSVLKVHVSSMTEGYEFYVTARDVPPRASGLTIDLVPNAIAVEADANGFASGPRLISEIIKWHDGTGTAITPLSSTGSAAFEVVKPYEGDGVLRDPIFFVVARGPVSQPPFAMISSFLAPYYSTQAAHNPSRTLPVPRFVPGAVPMNLVFDPIP